jgi:hypothetical protein
MMNADRSLARGGVAACQHPPQLGVLVFMIASLAATYARRYLELTVRSSAEEKLLAKT